MQGPQQGQLRRQLVPSRSELGGRGGGHGGGVRNGFQLPLELVVGIPRSTISYRTMGSFALSLPVSARFFGPSHRPGSHGERHRRKSS